MKINLRSVVLLACACLAAPSVGADQALYENNLEAAEAGKVPNDFLVLSGNFAVKALGTNQVLELPGAPLDGFAAQFGPAVSTNVAVGARVFGTARGQRGPAFGVGVGGAGGWRLQVSPGRRALELFKDQELKASTPYDWKTGTWTQFRLQTCQAKDGGWRVEGRVWTDGSPEPKAWMLTVDEPEPPIAGRASVVGAPFAGTPIWFDDLRVEQATR